MKYTEVKGNLFNADRKYVFAHCIATDCRMGAGIATQFARRNPSMRSVLLDSQPLVGDVLYFDDEKDRVFNLFTKNSSWDKPAREDFNRIVISLKNCMVSIGFRHLAIPLIGSGLDRLDWNITEDFIMRVFADTDIEILVYRL